MPAGHRTTTNENAIYITQHLRGWQTMDNLGQLVNVSQQISFMLLQCLEDINIHSSYLYHLLF